MRVAAAAGEGANAAGAPAVSSTATLLPCGSLSSSTRASLAARSSRVSLASRRPIRGAVSITSAAATGPSPSASQPAPRSTGRASASAKSTSAAIRRSKSTMWLSWSRRRLATARSRRNRRAGNSCGTGLRRITRCSTNGTATSAAPPRSIGVMNDRPMGQNRLRRLTRYSIRARSNCMLVSIGT